MAKKIIKSDEEARRALLRGAQVVSSAVGATLGPRGRNVILDKKWGSPTITKDGVTVAKEIELSDPFENMGAQLVREVASKTNDVAGDGTTSSVVLAAAIAEEGLKVVASGANPVAVKRGIEKAVDAVVVDIRRHKVNVTTREEIAQVASIAGNDKEIGNYIADAMDKVGKDGVITIEESKGTDTILELVEGMQFEKGYISPYFVTDPEKMEAKMEKPLILVYEKKISSAVDIVPVMEKAAAVGRSLLIIAEDVDGDALSTLVVNKLRGNIPSCVVKAPGFGDRRKEMLRDIATLTGAEFISEDLGVKLDSVIVEQMGSASTVVVTKDNTTIIEGSGKDTAVKGRIAQIKKAIETTESSYDREKLQERLAKLTGGVAVIKVGAATETALKEKKHRFEDALSATKAAVEEGIVAGGGVALIRAIPALDKLKLKGDEAIGASIVKKALQSPLRKIAENAGHEGSVVTEKVMTSANGLGFDAATETYRDMFEAGIVDPVKVTRSALENAASIVALILTTEALVADAPEDKKECNHQGGGNPGGYDY